MSEPPRWLAELDDAHRAAVVPADRSRRIDPQLAATGDGRPRSGDVFERKLDGMRLLAHLDEEGRVQLRSRTHEERSKGFPELVEALQALGPRHVVADGEVVAYDGAATSFSRLQGRIGLNDPVRARLTGIAVHLEVFDLLHLDGYDVRPLPLLVRKGLLQRELEVHEPLRLVPAVSGEAQELLADACRQGWEGLIAKDPAAPYRAGRSSSWRKLKCHREGRFVVGGWTQPRGSRAGFGALLLGEMDGDRLRYVGKVGTGFSEALLARLTGVLEQLERRSSPFDDAPEDDAPRFVEPRLVADVAYSERTHDGRLRHPRFLGLHVDDER